MYLKFLMFMLGVLSFVSCNRVSERQQCYESECKGAVGSCLIFTQILFSPLLSSSTPVSVSDRIFASSESNETNNGTYSNTGFLTLSSFYSSSGNTINVLSGDMSSGTDIDIFVGSLFSSSSENLLFYDVSQTAGTATCTLSTRAGSSSLTTAIQDSTFTTIGTLSATVTPVTLTVSGQNRIYIRCSGVSGAQYTLRYLLSSKNTSSTTPSTTSSFSSLTNLLSLSCLTAKSDCKAACNKKHDL